MMSLLRLRYVHSFVDKTGSVRYYFRHQGRRWPLPGLPGSQKFGRRYDELRAQHLGKNDSPSRIAFAPSTFGWLIEQWLRSKDFASKGEGTKERYRQLLDEIKLIAGRGLIVDLQEHHVREIRTRFMDRTSSADAVVMLISMLWIFAKEHLAIQLGPNPTSDIQTVHRQTYEHEPWPDHVIAKFEAQAKPRGKARLALLLLLYTGQRIGDVCQMTWERYDGEGIEVRQQKTDELLWIPCHHRLKTELDRTPRLSKFILTTQMKDGYGRKSLGNMFTWALAEIGAKGFSAHGLRKNAAIALAEAGCTVPEIMSITGHRTYEQALAYIRRASQKKLAKEAIHKLETADEVANSRTATGRKAG